MEHTPDPDSEPPTPESGQIPESKPPGSEGLLETESESEPPDSDDLTDWPEREPSTTEPASTRAPKPKDETMATDNKTLRNAVAGFTPRTWKTLKSICSHKRGYRVPGGEAKAAQILIKLELAEEKKGGAVLECVALPLGRDLAEEHERTATGAALPEPQ